MKPQTSSRDEGGTVQAGRGSAWIYPLKHTFLPPKIGCRQSLKKPLGQVMATVYSPVLLFFSQDEIIWSTELSSSFLRERIYVAQAGLHPHWASWVLGFQAGTLMPGPDRKCSRTFIFKEPSSRCLPYCNHFTGFVILFCQNQDGSMGMITVAQIVYKETILRKNLMSQSLLSLALELDNKMTSKVNDSCPFFRATSPSFKAWKLHPELRRPCASSKGNNRVRAGQGAGLSFHLSATG